jgi:hypothetical protein
VLADMNANNEKFNIQRGYKPGDPHYQPPIPMGIFDGSVRPDPVQIVGAIYFNKHGGLSPDVKPSNLDEQRKNMQSEEEHRKGVC